MKVPYPMVAAMAVPEREAQMLCAVDIANARSYPRLRATPIDDRRSLILACYGPSLSSQLDEIRRLQASGQKILSMSGATRLLADAGIIADYHLDMDPRAFKAKHLDPPVDGVEYLMASVCPPETWEILRSHCVTLWHTYSGLNPTTGVDTYRWVAINDPSDPPQLVIHGGSTIGLTAIHIGGVLGYRHFEIFGMDGSFASHADGTRGPRHAGVHFGTKQTDGTTWQANRVKYHTSKIMSNAVTETLNLIEKTPLFAIFHGDGLTQALIRKRAYRNACCADETARAAKIRTAVAKIYTPPFVGGQGAFWEQVIDRLPPEELPRLLNIIAAAEPRRARATFNTGSVPLESLWLLAALRHHYRPKVVVEIGTFIGSSAVTLAHESAAVFTCDQSNDCLAARDNVHTYPKQSSTTMLRALVDQGLAGAVDLFFVDGRLQPDDLPLIEILAHPKTVYACDDVHGREKGTKNIERLRASLPEHVFIPPYGAFAGRSTVGVLVPLTQPVEAVA